MSRVGILAHEPSESKISDLHNVIAWYKAVSSGQIAKMKLLYENVSDTSKIAFNFSALAMYVVIVDAQIWEVEDGEGRKNEF